MNRFLRRVSPPTASGHGCSRCQTRLSVSVSASERPVMPKSIRIFSRIIRCRASSLVQGSSPFRTRFMVGPYPARQASANFAASTVRPFRIARSCTSLVTDVRQSTTVPKTSKTSAFTDATGWSSRPRSGWPTAATPFARTDVALTIPTVPACRNSRRETDANRRIMLFSRSAKFSTSIRSSTEGSSPASFTGFSRSTQATSSTWRSRRSRARSRSLSQFSSGTPRSWPVTPRTVGR